MKNMMFIFRGLVKVSMLLVLMVSAQSVVAQSFSTQADAFTNSSSKDAITASNADYVSSTEAITNLNAESATLRDSAPTTSAAKFAKEIKVTYFRHIAGQINTGSSVEEAMTQSTTVLNRLFAKVNDTYGLTKSDLFAEALNLVSN